MSRRRGRCVRSPEEVERDAAVGLRLRELREQRGLTQAEVAAAAGVDASRLGLIERGQRRLPLSVLERLAVALEVTPAEVLGPRGEGRA